MTLHWPRRPLLPIAAAGLAVLLPWHALQLVQGWRAFADSSNAAAASPTTPAPEPAPVEKPPQNNAALPGCNVGPGTPAQSADSGLVAEIARRAAELDRRDQALRLHETQLAAAAKLAAAQMAELEQMRRSVESLVVRQTTASDADMQLLVGLYSNMKPVQAAVVLSKIDPPKAAEILQHLETRMAGPILAAMEPASAVKVTEVLEQRNAAFRP